MQTIAQYPAANNNITGYDSGNTPYYYCIGDGCDGSSIIYVDNIQFTPDFSFHPDVDVRKRKSSNDYGLDILTEYKLGPLKL